MISVIMLTYNRKGYVRNMIEDILQQTYEDFEFIIVDNGSTDGTYAVLEEYAGKDRRIKAYHIAAGSVGYGRNFGLKMSGGEYVAFVDDDDRVKNDFLLFLFMLVEQEKADISMCGATELRQGKVYPQCLFDERVTGNGKEALKWFLERKYIRAGMPTKLIRREILLKHPFKEDCQHEDIHTIYKYLTEASKVVLWGVDKYCFVRHGENLSFFTTDQSQWNATKIQEYRHAFAVRTQYVSIRCPELRQLALYSEWSYLISMVDKIETYHIEECRSLDEELISQLKSVEKQFWTMPYTKDFEREWMKKYLG